MRPSPQVLDWLLEPSSPSVRYLTMTRLLGRSPEDPEVEAARRAIMTTGAVPQILANQNDDGSWGLPEKFYTLKYTGTVWTVLLLAELAADPADPRVRKACEFILSHSWNEETGGFSYQQSARTEKGLSSGVIPCLTGNMVYSLIRLGYLDDERVQRAIDWIVTWQRADDGIDYRPDGAIYKRMTSCLGRHSCHMGVAKSLKALTAIPPDRRSEAVQAKLTQLTDYFLLHHLYKKSHQLDQIAKPGWLKPGFPLMYNTDIVELLELFLDLGIDDPRLQDAKDILRSRQQPDSRWILENTFNGKMQIRIEQKDKPSKWITLKALRILSREVE